MTMAEYFTCLVEEGMTVTSEYTERGGRQSYIVAVVKAGLRGAKDYETISVHCLVNIPASIALFLPFMIIYHVGTFAFSTGSMDKRPSDEVVSPQR